MIKRAFFPKLDALLFFDYKQLEYRLLAFFIAHTLGDHSMAEVFRRGDDLHDESARAVLQKEEITEAERDFGKTYNFLTIYGGGAPKAAASLGITVAHAKAQQSIFHERWPSIKQLHNPPFRNGGYRIGEGPGVIQRRYDERGYLTTLFGRHLDPVDEYGKKAPHKALNWVIQGSGGDLARVAMVKIHAALKAEGMQSHLVNYVHDEFVLDAVEEEIAYLSRLIPTLMDYELVSEIVPIEVDMEWSHHCSWADKTTYKEGASDGRPGDTREPHDVDPAVERESAAVDRDIRVRTHL